ncbi:hypothetical protein ACIQVU_19410 [Lysinibacillus sp. NPDC098008]|uniref:hypothetical protein n=2 Tax=Lysinibacillus TaxID=400634 RepID=UPI00382EB14F
MMDKQMEDLLFEAADNARSIVVELEHLNAIRIGVERLMERIEEVIYKKWHENMGVAQLTIIEMEQSVRLLDLAFNPLFEKMRERAITLDENIEQLRNVTSE